MANDTNKPKDPEKTVDLPPHGSRNPDPITDTPGSHPIETGVGAVIGGAASGLAVGAVAGPVGAVIGAIAGGAVAGGYAGKGVGELIDPTTEDNWLREYYSESQKKGTKTTHTAEDYRPAYKYGMTAATSTATSGSSRRTYTEAETDLRSGWEKEHGKSGLAWDQVSGAVRDAYDRSIKLHEERLNVNKEQVKTGDVAVRKEVITEHKRIDVPVEREEVVIERRAVSGHASAGDIKAEEIRIPVKEEKVNVSKETVVKEEVSVGKRTVTDTKTVDADVRREEVKVEQTGSAKVTDARK